MARCKVKNEDLKELAEIYNSQGKKAVYALLDSRYGVKNPYFVLRRMYETPTLAYDAEIDHFQTDQFQTEEMQSAENIFMSMEELCSPIVTQHVSSKEQQELDSRPAAMDKLIRQLIGDRLLELNKYVTIDSLSKRIIVDKTTLTQDGYQLVTH